MKVIVRWWDGYLQVFDEVEEWRAGAYLLWIRQKPKGHNAVHQERHIPLTQVRWFSPIPSDREYLEKQVMEQSKGGEKNGTETSVWLEKSRGDVLVR